MRIARAPLRITLGGGGTDLPGYYEKFGGFLIAGAINKFIYMTSSLRPFDKDYWLSYSHLETCKTTGEIKHELFRKSLEKYHFPSGIEIHSVSEVPGNSGLGSSGSFLVCLLTLLNAYSKKEATRHEVAELASSIEMVELKKACGKQDHFAAAYGGIITMEIDKSGRVVVKDLDLEDEVVRRLQSNILIYHTGQLRFADDVLKQQTKKLISDDASTVSKMMRIKEIGYLSKECLLRGDLDKFGRFLHEHWMVKKDIQGNMSNSTLDNVYNEALKEGMLGGKIMGAGGGGYFMFYVPGEKQVSFRKRMRQLEMIEMGWTFNFAGCEVIFSN